MPNLVAQHLAMMIGAYFKSYRWFLERRRNIRDSQISEIFQSRPKHVRWAQLLTAIRLSLQALLAPAVRKGFYAQFVTLRMNASPGNQTSSLAWHKRLAPITAIS